MNNLADTLMISRMIIENRSENGNIEQADQPGLREDIIALIRQEVRRELKQIPLDFETSSLDDTEIWVSERIAQLTDRKEEALRNQVSDITYEKLLEAGWTGPRPDAQEIADQLPHSLTGDDSLEMWSWNHHEGRKWNVSYVGERRIPNHLTTGDTMAEALALLWLKLHEVPHE